jgi:uncharacterized repeat protein (TIGR01451 family)
MKDILKQILSVARVPKKTLMFALAMVAVFGIVGSAHAWFPDRPTYTIAHPADHVTFNSITDNPNYGDERTFFDAKDAANTSKGGFVDKVNVQDGEEVLLRVYVHNNAADNLNGTNFNGPGVAKNTKVRIFLPTAASNALRANAYVTADNAQPKEVSDTVDFAGNGNFTLSYVPGSAVSYTNAVPSGMKLSDSIVTTGAPIGYTQANGIVPGCFEYTSIVTVKAKVHKPKFTITKQVALPGNPWTKNVTANPGDTVSYLLTVTNTGNSVINGLAVRDQLPAHQRIVAGSTTITNGNHPQGVSAGSDAVVANGIDIGSYNPNAVAYVKFKVTIDPVEQLSCGANNLVNTATVFKPGDNTTASDTAQVTVNKTCKDVPVTPTTPTVLPNAGAGDVIGIFSAVTIAGAIAHRLFWVRRQAR